VSTKSDETVANLEAIDENAAVILCETPMRRGKAVLMKASSCALRGRVAGCRKDEIVPGYRVLLEFSEHVVWNRNLFSPEHLVDMQELAKEALLGAEKTSAIERAFSAGQTA
jgi:hypothetical protein